jgi:hypothetical protein
MSAESEKVFASENSSYEVSERSQSLGSGVPSHTDINISVNTNGVLKRVISDKEAFLARQHSIKRRN